MSLKVLSLVRRLDQGFVILDIILALSCGDQQPRVQGGSRDGQLGSSLWVSGSSTGTYFEPEYTVKIFGVLCQRNKMAGVFGGNNWDCRRMAGSLSRVDVIS